MKVCVLAQASPCTWVAHYVAAFRAECETLVAGPPPDAEALKRWDREAAAALALPPDIPLSFEEDCDLEGLFPSGWTPDLVVGIAGVDGRPLHPGVARLRCPTALITVDTWQCIYDYRQALHYDFVFAAQKQFAPLLHESGSLRVSWLPLACDPECHHPCSAEPVCDITFAGMAASPVHAPRRRLLEALSRRFSVEARERLFGEALCAFCAQGRLLFNHCAVRELNMRVFEAMAMGRPLLTNREAELNGLLELFEDGRHLLVYQGEEDLFRTAERYLGDETARNAVAEAGRREVLEYHTYRHRVRQLIEVVRAHAGRQEEREKAYTGPEAHAYLPTVPGNVVDYGLGLKASKVALRHLGVTELIGVATTPLDTERRRGSYDRIVPFAATRMGDADTVVIASLETLPVPPEEALRRAHQLLRPGGTLVLRLTGPSLVRLHMREDAAAMEAVLQTYGFHLRLRGAWLEDGGCVIQARKRTRYLRDIVRGAYETLAVPGIDVDDLAGRIPEGW